MFNRPPIHGISDSPLRKTQTLAADATHPEDCTDRRFTTLAQQFVLEVLESSCNIRSVTYCTLQT